MHVYAFSVFVMCVNTCTCTYWYTCTCTYWYTCTYVHTGILVHVHTGILVHVHTGLLVYVYSTPNLYILHLTCAQAMATGAVEVELESLEVLNEASHLSFSVSTPHTEVHVFLLL